MDYSTEGSSNLVHQGQEINLDITISPAGKGDLIRLVGPVTIENLDQLQLPSDLRKLKCMLSCQPGKKNISLDYNSIEPGKRRVDLGSNFNAAYSHFNFRLKAPACALQSPEMLLKITFYDANNIDERKVPVQIVIEFEVLNQQTPLAIHSFTTDWTVLQANNEPVTLSWNTSGDNYTYVLREGLAPLTKGEAKGQNSGSWEISDIAVGDHEYVLELTQGAEVVTLPKKVRALSAPALLTVSPAAHSSIANFCISHNADFIYALFFNTKDNATAEIDSIGFNNEGFAGKWSHIGLSAEDKEKLKPFASSPMLHLAGSGKAHGCLFFVGGSKVKPMQCYNDVAIINLDEHTLPGAQATARVVVIENRPWAARMGQACVVFPHGIDADKIWMMGGIDEYGTALNDAWVSADGMEWQNVLPAENLPANAPAASRWGSRGLAGISVELAADGSREAIWLGGGFAEIGGKEMPDIWKYDGKSWSNTSMLINDRSYQSSGVAFVGKDASGSPGIGLLGCYEKWTDAHNSYLKQYAYGIDFENNIYKYYPLDIPATPSSLVSPRSSSIATGYFKGCLWYLVFSNAGAKGITYSPLFCWVPVTANKTLLLL